MDEFTPSLRKVFPKPESGRVPEPVRRHLHRDEFVVWHGGPARWGLFRATPFVLVLVVVAGMAGYLSANSGMTLWQSLRALFGAQHGPEAMILPGLTALYGIILALALRDPRERWIYAATNRRLLTFFKGRPLREADVDKLRRLEVVRGLEGALRNTGDVVWARVNRSHSAEGRGPDQGRHGFRGMRDPRQWHERLIEWGRAIQRDAARDARAFEHSMATPRNQDGAGRGQRRLENHRFRLSITVPERWVGRIGLRERAPFRILGITMPFQQIIEKSRQPLHDPPEEWNFIFVEGRSGMKFHVNVNQGLPAASFETSRDKVGERLIDASGDYRCGPLSGYYVDYLYLDRLRCRYAMLAGDGFHLLIKVTIPPDQAEDLLPAVDAALRSIRAI